MVSRLTAILSVAALGWLALIPSALAAPPYRVSHDQVEFTTTVEVDARDGLIRASDIAAGIAQARGYDESLLSGRAPSCDLDPDRWTTRWSLAALNWVCRPDVTFTLRRASTDRPACLVIHADREAAQATQRGWKRRIRNAVATVDVRSDKPEFGLRLDDRWAEQPNQRDLILGIHGYNSCPEELEPVLEGSRAVGFACGHFSYPNDQAIEESADLLARELKALKRTHPQRRITLLTHSMGGLVARAVIEDPQRDPGTVRRLVMIATPNHGSALACISWGADWLEYGSGQADRPGRTGWLDSFADGMNEAGTDLTPGSIFLTKLNRRPRNARVEYSIFLGVGGRYSQEEFAREKARLQKWVRRNGLLEIAGNGIERALGDGQELIRGYGDGVVSAERGRLAGVVDTVIADFQHGDVLDTTDAGSGSSIRRIVQTRLKGSDPHATAAAIAGAKSP